ncbi:GSCOCG00009439001-RA-CDS [Cotesia congregata]|nr:GSCOCG00009439001-RA-CDS [Cotesia congregata]
MAEFDAKINMSLDEIIKLDRREKKKNVNGKPAIKRNLRRNNTRATGRPRNAAGVGTKTFNANFKKNFNKNGVTPNAKKRNQSQAWRLQRGRNANQPNSGFITKRYKQQMELLREPSLDLC